eukprot:TRINITY_DN8885_c0_g1_i1.p2 TRINITY_DN8885_c0_g1~~TRINITY_DN8885_c0_g1_i1.p2  ORF type:complete len:105 (+),score=5.88 TRINITY_DN8885_c0_g1_i1:367-681(+)
MPGERAQRARRPKSQQLHSTSPAGAAQSDRERGSPELLISRARTQGRAGPPPRALRPSAAADPLAVTHSAPPSRGSPPSTLGPSSLARLSAAPRRAAPAAAVDL